MTDRECVIRRSISCSEARSTECCLHNSSCFHKICNCTILNKFHINRCTCRVNAECKFICSNVLSFDDICSCTDIFKSTTCTSCDDSLLYIELTVSDLILQRVINCTVKTYKCFLLYIMKDVCQICVQFINCINIAWVERHCDHWLDLA